MEEFTEFLKLCKKHLKKQPAIVKLIKKRHKESRKEYLDSAAFQSSLHIARAKIESNPNEVFLYIRDFLQELKLNKDEEYERKKRKRNISFSNDDENPPKKIREKEESTAEDSPMQGIPISSGSTTGQVSKALYKCTKTDKNVIVIPFDKSKKLCTEASATLEKNCEPLDDIQIESLESSSEDEHPTGKTVLKGEDEEFEVVLNDDYSNDSTDSVLVDYNISGIRKDLKDTCDSTVKDDLNLVSNNDKHKEENIEQTSKNDIKQSAVVNNSSNSSHYSSEGCIQNTKSADKMEKIASCESIDKSPDSTTTDPQEKQHFEGSFSSRSFKDVFKKLKNTVNLVKENLPFSPLSTGEVLPDSSSKMDVDVSQVEVVAAGEIQHIEQTDEVEELNEGGVESRENKTNEKRKETAGASSSKTSKGGRLLKIIRNRCSLKVQQNEDFDDKTDDGNQDCMVISSPEYSENAKSDGLCEGEGFHNASDSPLKIVRVTSEAELKVEELGLNFKIANQGRVNDEKVVEKRSNNLSSEKDMQVERMDTNMNTSDTQPFRAENPTVKETKIDEKNNDHKTSNTKPLDISNKNQDIEIDVSEMEQSGSYFEPSAGVARSNDTEKDDTDTEIRSLNKEPSKGTDKKDKTRDIKKDRSEEKPKSGDQKLSTGDQGMTKKKAAQSEDKETGTKSLDGVPSTSAQDDTKKKKKGSKKQVERLEKLLEDIRDKIEQLKEAEVDLDDEDSAYIMEEKYQKKFVKVWNKLCEIKESSADTGRPSQRKFRYSGTRYPEINRKIEKFVNKKKCFPDYNDIRDIIVSVNNSRALHLKGSAIDRLAREAFADVGDQLQKRREEDLKYTFLGHLPRETKIVRNEDDPAYEDKILQLKLEENKKVSRIRLNAVIEKFVVKQDKRGMDDDDEDDDDEEEHNEEEDAMEEENEDVEVPEMDQIINEDSQIETDSVDTDQQIKETETSFTNSSDKMKVEDTARNTVIKQEFEVKIKEVCDMKIEEVCESKTEEVCESKAEEVCESKTEAVCKSNSEEKGPERKLEACSIISVYEASDIVKIDDEDDDDDVMIVQGEGFLPKSMKGIAENVKKEPGHDVKETQQNPEEVQDFFVKLQSEIFSELQSISKKCKPPVKSISTAKKDKPQNIGKFVVDFTGEGSRSFKARTKAPRTVTLSGNSKATRCHHPTSVPTKGGGKVGVKDDSLRVVSTSIRGATIERETEIPRKTMTQANNANNIRLIPLNAMGGKLFGESVLPSGKNMFGTSPLQQDGANKKAETYLLSKTAKYTGGTNKRLGKLTSIPHSNLLSLSQTRYCSSQENPHSFNKYSSLISKSRNEKSIPAKTAVTVVEKNDDDIIVLD